MNVTEDIKSRLDIVDVVGEYLPLRKAGRSYTGFCPFHPNTRTPSFVVFPDSQSWRCFGACAEGGDVFTFLMKKEGWDFKEALARLATRTGVVLEERPVRSQAEQDEAATLRALLAAAAEYYHQLLLHAPQPQAEGARRYVAGRGLTAETIDAFKLGYALNAWDAARDHFMGQGYTADNLLAAGLLSVNEDKGTRYDRFRGRLIFPIREAGGAVVGFGARTLAADDQPKYLNSPQTTLFDKSRLLYNLDQAKRQVREARQAVIVEGYMDVIQAWQAGFHNVVAQMGTALTEPQLRLLKRYTKSFVLALDADAAGAAATLRSLAVARETLDRQVEVRFDARGLIRHEGRLQADIRVAVLPPGHDPDKLIRSDPAAWPKLMAAARPVVEYVIGVLAAPLDLNDAKAKAAVAAQVLPLIADVADPVERDHYRQLLARTLKVDERALRGKLSAVSRQPSAGGKSQAAGDSDNQSPISNLQSPVSNLRQANYLRQCLGYPHLARPVDQRLVLNQQPVVTERDFALAEDKAIFGALRRRLVQGGVAGDDELWETLDDSLAGRAQALLALPKTAAKELDRLPDVLVVSVLDWRLDNVKALLGAVEQLIRQAREQNDADIAALYGEQVKSFHQMVLNLNKAKDAMLGMKRKMNNEQ